MVKRGERLNIKIFVSNSDESERRLPPVPLGDGWLADIHLSESGGGD